MNKASDVFHERTKTKPPQLHCVFLSANHYIFGALLNRYLLI